jgi:hypothetical protein
MHKLKLLVASAAIAAASAHAAAPS